MAFLAAAEDGAEEGAAGDVDFHFIHIGPSVEQDTRVTHACAEEVASDRVRRNLSEGARHAQGTATHVDCTFAENIGHLITTIHIGEDVAARDVDGGIALHHTSRATPNGTVSYRIPERIVTRAAAKHIAEEAVAIGALRGTAFGVVSSGVSVDIVHIVFLHAILNFTV